MPASNSTSTSFPTPLPSLHSGQDRKSTRLNSSLVRISYAVFCLKKKKLQGEKKEPECGVLTGTSCSLRQRFFLYTRPSSLCVAATVHCFALCLFYMLRICKYNVI